MITVRNFALRFGLALSFSIPLLLSGCGGSDDNAATGSSAASSAPGSAGVASAPAITLSGTPPSSVVAGNPYVFQPTVSTTGGTVSFSASGFPSWASVNSSTGQISGTPTSSQVGTTGSIVITATDGSATASLAAFKIDVTAAGSQTAGTVSLSWAAPTENTNGTAVTDLAGYHIHYGTSASALSSEIDVPGAATTSYEISNLSAGTYYFTVSAYNSLGVESAPSGEASQTI